MGTSFEIFTIALIFVFALLTAWKAEAEKEEGKDDYQWWYVLTAGFLMFGLLLIQMFS